MIVCKSYHNEKRDGKSNCFASRRLENLVKVIHSWTIFPLENGQGATLRGFLPQQRDLSLTPSQAISLHHHPPLPALPTGLRCLQLFSRPSCGPGWRP